MLYNLVHAVIYVMFRATAAILGRLRSTGQERVPRSGPVIFCPNHVSDSDPAIVLVTLPRKSWFIGKEELFAMPMAGLLFRIMHGIPIKRDSADRAALRRAEEILKRGESIVIFPEGRCAEDGRLQTIQPGASLLALRTGAKIVPVGLKNTAQLLPYGATNPRRTKEQVTAEYGEPIDPADFMELPKRDRVDSLTDRLGREIMALLCH